MKNWGNTDSVSVGLIHVLTFGVNIASDAVGIVIERNNMTLMGQVARFKVHGVRRGKALLKCMDFPTCSSFSFFGLPLPKPLIWDDV